MRGQKNSKERVKMMSNISISTVDLYLTGSCNYKCEYCYGESDTSPHMTYETLMNCLNFAEYICADTIELCGGEPLISPLFETAVLEARKKGFKVIVRTNGILLDQYIDLIAYNCEWVGISLDCLAEINAKMRPSRQRLTKEEQFDIPIKNIKKLKQLNPNIKIILATIATAENYAEILSLMDFVFHSNLPVDKWKIYQFIEDKFRSVVYSKKYALSSEKFLWLKTHMPETLPSGGKIIMQSADVDGAGGNCLLVSYNGTIKILGEYYGKIGQDDYQSICDNLNASSVIKYIQQNKEVTYV